MRRPWRTALVVLVLLGLGGGFLVWRQRQPLVSASLDPAFPALGHAKRTVSLILRAGTGSLGGVEVRVVQDGAARTVLTEDLAGSAAREARRPLALDAAALGLKEGAAELQVFARDDRWRPRPDFESRLTHRFSVDLTPPTVELRTATGYIKHAGSGVVVYRVTGAVRSGVQVGGAFFPGVSGLAADPAIHVALFTTPYYAAPVAPSILAEDEAGNQRMTGVPVTFLPARLPKDTITLTTAFLSRKVPELAPQTPGTATPDQLLQAFLGVNGEGRKANEAKIREIAQGPSAPRPLGRGAFRQQPNTKVFANFPEERTYQVDGRTVDTQWHLGIDLASRRQSPVEASNAGRVAFAGPNGIYGNMVVLDHGLGLFSLYAHLSEMSVKEGQEVKQGETLGRTGETGLAGGDHLHFALLIHGVYTTPLEWWDDHWLRDRIAKPLTDAGLSVPGLTDNEPAPAAPPASPRRTRRP